MAGKSSQSNNRGSNLFGYFVSGKFKEYHTQQFAAAAIVESGMTASGGVINDYATPPGAVYRAHIFTGSGIFEVTDDTTDFGATVEYLVVAGGGAAGINLGGGGGAGGLRTNVPGTTNTVPQSITAPAYPVSNGQYTVVVGAGGAGDYAPTGSSLGQPGNNSEFYPTPVSYPSTARIRSVGGGGSGGGNTDHPAATRAGGSGGGSPGYGTNPTGGPGNPTDPNHPQRQGFDGGSNGPSYGNNYIGGGGGGANSSGPGPTATSGAGGSGIVIIRYKFQ